ncbi:MAG: hypothetical protein Q7T41_04150 [Candidatus Saccharibacteria bacterium]|nr:hypothetical protein [Candidatus Saccharibacteria bacterium]
MIDKFTLELDVLNPNWQQQNGQALQEFWKEYTQRGGDLKGLLIIGGVVIHESNSSATQQI